MIMQTHKTFTKEITLYLIANHFTNNKKPEHGGGCTS